MMPIKVAILGINDYLFDNARATTLDLLPPEGNATSLTDILRSALSNTSIQRSWDYEMDTDFEAKDRIHYFAEKVGDIENDIIKDASMLLDEFDVYLSSPTNFADNFRDVAMIGDAFRFNESSSGSYFNLSIVSLVYFYACKSTVFCHLSLISILLTLSFFTELWRWK